MHSGGSPWCSTSSLRPAPPITLGPLQVQYVASCGLVVNGVRWSHMHVILRHDEHGSGFSTLAFVPKGACQCEQERECKIQGHCPSFDPFRCTFLFRWQAQLCYDLSPPRPASWLYNDSDGAADSNYGYMSTSSGTYGLPTRGNIGVSVSGQVSGWAGWLVDP